MFTVRTINKYLTKLLPRLEARYGKQPSYTASQVRATVYQCNFNPEYLPLGYILALSIHELIEVFSQEFPQLNIHTYKHEIYLKLKKRKVKNIDIRLNVPC